MYKKKIYIYIYINLISKAKKSNEDQIRAHFSIF